jgi:ATPase family associated with various cellular activities (AAA)
MPPFPSLPHDPGSHLRLWFYAAVGRLVDSVDSAGAIERFPFLAGYRQEMHAHLPGDAPGTLSERWLVLMRTWEAALPPESAAWPLRRLTAAGLGSEHLLGLLLAGLVEEDARFGALYAALQPLPDETRPTVGLLGDLLRPPEPDREPPGWPVARVLSEHGLVMLEASDRPRAARSLRVPEPIWDALRGERPARPAPGLTLYEADAFVPPGELHRLLPAELASRLARAPELLRSGAIGGVVLRGMAGSGRVATIGSLARATGRRLLVLDGPAPAGLEAGCRLLGPLATLYGALPVVSLELGPGQSVELPPLSGYVGPIGATLGQDGALHGDALAGCVSLKLPPPGPAARRVHWETVLGPARNGQAAVLDQISARFHLSGGTIQRAGRLALAYAALDGRGPDRLRAADVQDACRALSRQSLDALAVRLEPGGGWGELVTSESTRRELEELTLRCRQREWVLTRLGPAFGRGVTRGVRALFSGPSGTGKTLAARTLAAELGLDVYRVDLASIVDKYVGETERNLSRLFARAEEQDVILLLDEGDSLMTGRTDVHSANDRYANLETNYLLQRLEGYEGILVVTTNAAGRIDRAFQRRMDVLVEFSAPDVAQRHRIWQLHLPPENGVPEGFLRTVATRCVLSGGQIRNAAFHATVLALDAELPLDQTHLAAAVAREYRKLGAASPLGAVASRA